MGSEKARMWLGILLIVVGIFYKPGEPTPPVVDNKLKEPAADIVVLVKDISISDNADSSKLAGMFNAMSTKLDGTTLNSNLQVQYFMNAIGKNTFGSELMDNGNSKYPKFAPAVAEAMTSILGPQTDTSPVTSDKKRKLARLFYGLSWKLYKSSNDEEYEEYKAKALSAIAEYNKEDEPLPPPDSEDCPCEGKGYIIHGDGHQTDCPCVASGTDCEHDPKCGTGDLPDLSTNKSSGSQVYKTTQRRRGILRGIFRQ